MATSDRANCPEIKAAESRAAVAALRELGPAPRFPLPLAYADPAFVKCLTEAVGTKEMVEQFNRLAGRSLLARKSPIDQMIDRATSKDHDDMRAFCEFVHECIYTRLADEAIHIFRLAAIDQPEEA